MTISSSKVTFRYSAIFTNVLLSGYDLIEEFYINQSETKYDQILLNISFIKYGNEKIMIGYTGSCSIHQEGFGEIIFSDIEFSIEKEDIEKLTIFNEIPIQFQTEFN